MQHFYQNIQGWFGFQDLYQEQVDRVQTPAHFVEIGAWQGKSTAYMAVAIAQSGKQIKFDVVDTWQGSLEHQDDAIVKEQRLYDVFLNNIEPVKHIVNPQRMTSMEASKLYADHSLDFVFIDASHEYEDVLDDIRHWLPKVKPGGMLGGDDYNWPGVNRAVKELLPGHQGNRVYWTFRL